MLVADNVAGGPPSGLGGADPTITIPSVRITLADGQAIKAALLGGPVNATLLVDPTVRAGADRAGRALLYTPNPVQPGSTVSHWDTIATPNQLMEPAINNDLKLAVDVPYDLTRAQLRDVGWFPDGDLDGVADDAGDQCLGFVSANDGHRGWGEHRCPEYVLPEWLHDQHLVARCKTGGANHGAYVSCVADLTNTLKTLQLITGAQKGAIQRDVAHDN